MCFHFFTFYINVIHTSNKVFDKYVSTKEEAINKISIITENIVCLAISTFMFSLLLSFTITLYKFTLLTAIAKSEGIIIIF